MHFAFIILHSRLHPRCRKHCAASPRNMKPDDVCEIEITGVGVLRNKVVVED